MPRYKPRQLPGDWQIAPRWDESVGAVRYWLQERQPDGCWRDVRGPYNQRGPAHDYYMRRRHKTLSNKREAMHEHSGACEHEWVDRWGGLWRCAICGEERWEQSPN